MLRERERERKSSSRLMHCVPTCRLNTMRGAVVLTILINTLQLGTVVHLPSAAFAQQSVTDAVYDDCNKTIFSPNDSFAQNLDVVANSLTHNSSRFLYSLASSTIGSQSNYVHGMYQCRGDISLSDCSVCVINGLTAFRSTGVPSLCDNLVRGARVQYQGCYLRYENYKFYITADGTDYSVFLLCSGSANDSSPLYLQNLGTTLKDSATAAPRHPQFGYNTTSVGSGPNTVYALTQCLGYLNSSQCAACLSKVSNYSNACNRSVSGEVYFTACYYLFGNTSRVFTYNDPSPSVNSPAASPSLNPAIANHFPERGRRNRHKATIVGIVVGISALLAIIAAGLALYFLKRKKQPVKSEPLLNVDKELTRARRFSLKELQQASDNFHPAKKLGEGGFGPVYKVSQEKGVLMVSNPI